MNELLKGAELGYTPSNLRILREQHGLSQQQVADITSTKTWHSVSRWEAPIDSAYHADMPHRKWVLLLEHLAAQTA